MTRIPYLYITLQPGRYIFISHGRKRIVKAVEFVQLEISNAVNLVFGDLLSDNSIDTESNSNNGDMGLVLNTVIKILKDYTQLHSTVQVFIKGGTELRSRLYQRLIRINYAILARSLLSRS